MLADVLRLVETTQSRSGAQLDAMPGISILCVFLLLFTAMQGRAQSAAVTVTITNTPGYTIPWDFTGMGFEAGAVSGGAFFNATNTPLITLFQNMGVHCLRIGGGTSDGPSASVPSDSDISNLFRFAQSVGSLDIIYSLRLHNGNSATDTAIAQYIWQNDRSQLFAFALGNEPDWSSAQSEDPAITNFTSFLEQWGSFADAITDACPGAVFAGPDTGNDVDSGPPDSSSGKWANNGTEWTTDFAADEAGANLVALVTQHEYVADGSTIGSVASYTGAMLSPAWDTVTNQTLYNVMAARVLTNGLPYRFTEAEDCVGGVPGASDTFAGALWLLDYMHWWAAHDCEGVNFHNTRWRTNTVITVNNTTAGQLSVYPKGYGVKAFDAGGHGSVEPLGMANPDSLNLTAYAVADFPNYYVTLINREYGAGARAANVSLAFDNFPPGTVSAMSLVAPGNNVSATNGITLGGAAITNNAPWAGQWTALGSLTNGQFTVTVPSASAAIVQVTAAPVTLNVQSAGANQLQLSWAYGVLQAATNVAGPYGDLSNAASPDTISTTNVQEYYRVREN